MSTKHDAGTLYLKPIWIALAIIAVISAFFVWAILDGRRTLPDRLTTSIQEHVRHESSTPFNFNGDFSMDGVFQLSHSDTESLLGLDSILHCTGVDLCDIEKPHYISDHSSSYYCTTADDRVTNTTYDLCVDPLKNQAMWTYTSY